MLSFFPRDVLDEILNLIESVSEGFPSYSFKLHGGHETASETIKEKYVVVLLFYVHGKHLRSCRDGQLT